MITKQSCVPLAPLTTLKLGGAAQELWLWQESESAEALWRQLSSSAWFVLGGGSNVVVADEGFDGVVVKPELKGVRFGAGSDEGRVWVAAGESWDGFVEQCVARGLAGVECLSGIPGTVGATPIQNVGAYGQEVGDTLLAVHCFDTDTSQHVVLEPAQCAFRYRSSVFRGAQRYWITAAEFGLKPGGTSLAIRYAELAKALGTQLGERAPLAHVRRCVLALRGSKGMVLDPRDSESQSAGSFFTNPTRSALDLDALRARVGPLEVPVFENAGAGPKTYKASAAWLIEKAGFMKGTRRGAVGVSTKHALALVNYGGGTASELVSLAREIRDRVVEKFGVELRPEPLFLGMTW